MQKRHCEIEVIFLELDKKELINQLKILKAKVLGEERITKTICYVISKNLARKEISMFAKN